MNLLIILSVWLIAPFAELGIIIMLWISNTRYKEMLEGNPVKQIEKPAEKKEKLAGYGTWPVKRASSGPGGNWCQRQNGEWMQMQIPSGSGENDAENHLDGGSWNDCKVCAGAGTKEVLTKGDFPVQKGKGAVKLVSDIQENLGTISLIIGVVLVVLSGMIFATTRWQVLSDASKALFVLGASILFFTASYIAEKILDIHKTGNAFYILGSIFLFLTVVAAAYFRLFGPDFTLDEESRWMVLWIGSLVMEMALLTGLRRFHDRIYTQASLWGLTASICFMAKAFGAGWNELTGSMAWLGCVLTIGCLRCDSFGVFGSCTFNEPGMCIPLSSENKDVVSLVKKELLSFIPIHFLIACCSLFLHELDSLWLFLTCSSISSLLLPEDVMGRFILCIGAAVAVIILLLYVSEMPHSKGKIRKRVSFEQAGIYSMIGIYSLAGFARQPAVFRFTAVNLWFAAIQIVLLMRKKRSGKEEEEGDLSVPWELCGFGILTAGFLCTEGSREWIFGYLLMFALYFFRFVNIKKFSKGAGTLSACLIAAAMWEQPFFIWPDAFALEIGLLPAIMLIYVLGFLWQRTRTVKNLQNFGYVSCLVILSIDAFRTGLLADALILELVCLMIFICSQIKGAVWWVRISGTGILLIALFMTKEFWFRISWWVYLLAAGISLITFAAVNEKRKHKKELD